MAVTVLTNQDFTISAAGMYQFGDVIFEITGKQGGKYSGKVGDKTFRNWDKNGVRMLVGAEYTPRVRNGKETAANIPAKVDNSQAHGQHKVVAVSDNKLARQHRAVMQSLATINKVLGYQDAANMFVQSAWYEYAKEQQVIAERLRAEAEARAKAKAEAEAKAKAEAEAKAEAARVEAQRQMVELAAKNAGISIEEAEKNLRALGMIK